MTKPSIPGSAGIEGTIGSMVAAARGPLGAQSEAVRRVAEEAIQGRASDDFAVALGGWAAEHIEYEADPIAGELPVAPEQMTSKIKLWRRCAGQYGRCRADADDAATLVAAMALSLGLRVQLVVVGWEQPGAYTHVFARVERRPDSGEWVDVDPIAGERHDEVLASATTSRVFPIDEEAQ